jgi:hypothetical protein
MAGQLFSQTAAIDAKTHASIVAGDLGQIISTRNRELATYAIEAYYTSNTFQATINYTCMNLLTGENYSFGMKYPPAAHGARIRHLEIDAQECGFDHTLEDMLLPYRSG